MQNKTIIKIQSIHSHVKLSVEEERQNMAVLGKGLVSH